MNYEKPITVTVGDKEILVTQSFDEVSDDAQNSRIRSQFLQLLYELITTQQ